MQTWNRGAVHLPPEAAECLRPASAHEHYRMVGQLRTEDVTYTTCLGVEVVSQSLLRSVCRAQVQFSF